VFLVPVIASFAVLCVYVCMCARIGAWTACVLPRRELMGGLCGLKSACRKCTRKKAEKRRTKGEALGVTERNGQVGTNAKDTRK